MFKILISPIVLIFVFFYRGKANFRQIEKKILDSIIGPGRYDSRIRPHGINNTGKIF